MRELNLELMDELARDFYTLFADQFSGVACEVLLGDRLEIIIPARSPSFGDIHIWVDTDEITIAIGQYFHCHLATYFVTEDLQPEDVRKTVVAEALAFIADTLSGQVVLEVVKAGDDLIRSTVFYKGHSEPSASALIPVRQSATKQDKRSNRTTHRYTWFGPYDETADGP